MCSPQVRYILLIKSCHTKDYIYKHRIFCFSVWNTKLRRKNKDWLSRNHDNVSECDDFSTHFSEPPYNNSTRSLAMTQRKRQMYTIIQKYTTAQSGGNQLVLCVITFGDSSKDEILILRQTNISIYIMVTTSYTRWYDDDDIRFVLKQYA